MNIRDKLLRKARRSNYEIDWSSYKNQRNHVTSLVKKCKNRFYNNLLKENADSPSKFWAAVKKLYPTKQSAPSTGLVFDINGSKTSDNRVIANTLCNYFSGVANLLKSKSFLLRDFTWMKPSKHNFVTLYPVKFTLNEVCQADVCKELNDFKRKKATGLDKLPLDY